MSIFGCQHNQVNWPMRGWQKCLDCAAFRRYRKIGDTPGPWTKLVEVIGLPEKKPVPPQKLSEITE